MDWWRSWHGAPTDPKWLAVAREAGVIPAIVISIAWALFDHASQSEERGDVSSFDADAISAFIGCSEDDVDKVINAMRERGMIESGRLGAWEKRQPLREDSSKERMREHRKRAVTHSDAPDTDTDTDRDRDKKDNKSPNGLNGHQEEFNRFWTAFPRHVAKGGALKAFLKALNKASGAEIIAGAERYAASKPDPKYTKHPATWLNTDCWLDEPEKCKHTVALGPWKPVKPEPEGPKITEEERQANLAKLATVRFKPRHNP